MRWARLSRDNRGTFVIAGGNPLNAPVRPRDELFSSSPVAAFAHPPSPLKRCGPCIGRSVALVRIAVVASLRFCLAIQSESVPETVVLLMDLGIALIEMALHGDRHQRGSR